MRLLKWLVGAALGLHLALALLLLGHHPALVRGAVLVLSQAEADREGMRLAVYGQIEPAGKGRREFTPEAAARLEDPNTSLEAYAIWRVPKAGAYALTLRGDDRGAVFVDGHRVIGLVGRSANNTGRAAVSLGPGPHLLVVDLRNGPAQGWFSLEVQGPGEAALAPLPSQDLHPVSARYFPYFWRAVRGGVTWIQDPIFWISVAVLAVVAVAAWPARTVTQAALNGLLIMVGTLLAVGVGEVASRVLLPAPPTVTFKTTADADRPQNVFMIATDRGFRHSPNSEVVVVHPATRDTPTVYKTNSLGFRNREIGSKQGERILFLGDSITLGLALNEPFTFVRLVENLARADGRSWETVNGAVNSLGTNGELAVLNETGLSVAPDVVVLGFYLNDFLESPGIYLTSLPGLLDRSWLAHQAANLASRYLFLSSSERDRLDAPPMQKPPDEIAAWRKEFRARSTVMPQDQPADKATTKFNEDVLRHFEDWGGAFSPHVWEKLERLLAEFVRLSREHRFQFVIVAFPVRHQVETAPLFDYPQQRLREFSRAHQVPLLDLLPLLRAEFAQNGMAGRPVYLDHCHLTPYGSEVVARAVYEFLGQVRDTTHPPRPAP